MREKWHRISYWIYLKLCHILFRKGMERNYFIKNGAKLRSDQYGAPSADEEVTAASLIMMYADHPGDDTLLLLQDNSEQATMKITALYGTFSEPDTARHQLEYSQ